MERSDLENIAVVCGFQKQKQNNVPYKKEKKTIPGGQEDRLKSQTLGLNTNSATYQPNDLELNDLEQVTQPL